MPFDLTPISTGAVSGRYLTDPPDLSGAFGDTVALEADQSNTTLSGPTVIKAAIDSEEDEFDATVTEAGFAAPINADASPRAFARARKILIDRVRSRIGRLRGRASVGDKQYAQFVEMREQADLLMNQLLITGLDMVRNGDDTNPSAADPAVTYTPAGAVREYRYRVGCGWGWW